MLPGVSLAVGMAVNSDSAKVVSFTGEDCVLECTARYKPGVQYRSVKWYKVKLRLLHAKILLNLTELMSTKYTQLQETDYALHGCFSLVGLYSNKNRFYFLFLSSYKRAALCLKGLKGFFIVIPIKRHIICN